MSIRIMLLCLTLVACDKTIHTYPEVAEEGPAGATHLSLAIRTEAPAIHTVVDCTSGEPAAYTFAEWLEQTRLSEARSPEVLETLAALTTGARVDAGAWRLRLVWELYKGSCEQVRAGQARRLERACRYFDADVEEPQHDLDVSLPAGDYTLLAWADFVPTTCEGDYYYATGDMQGVLCDLDLRGRCDDNAVRDCFTECCEFTASGIDGDRFDAMLTRPQGRYTVLATDYGRYVELTDRPVEENRIVTFYPSFVNVGYAVAEGRPNESATGIGYTFVPRCYSYEGRETVCLADDCAFVNGEESHVQLDFDVEYGGKALASHRGIDIPLRPDRLTVVVGHFLTSSGDSGGVNIDEGFDDEIKIEY